MTESGGPHAPDAEVMGLDLGPGPTPQHPQEWEQRIEHGVQQIIADDEATGLWDQVRVHVTPAAAGGGAHLQELRLDLSGMIITEQHRSLGPQSLAAAEPPELSDTADGTIARVEVVAEPVHLEGVPVTVRAVLEALPVTFGRDEQGHLWWRLHSDQALAQMRGNGVVTVPLQDVVQRARGLVADELAQSGLTLADLDVQMRTPTPRRLLVMASARVRKGLLSASARLYVEVEVDDHMVARVGQVHARSGNPLVALVLAVVRGRLDKYTGTTVDLNAHLPPGVRLQEVSLHADTAITAEATFG